MIKILSDLHFGMRRNSLLFHSILMESLEWFLKDVKKSDSIVILGDIFDSRSSVDFRILNDAMNFFIKLSRKCKEVYILVGNHDLYYKENERSNVNCRFLEFEPSSDSKIAPVKVISEISEIKIQKKSCLFIPWISTLEQKECAREFLSGEYDVVFTHLDMVGIYGPDMIDERAFKDEDFGKNMMVLSGHFHKVSMVGRVRYIGAFINQTFNDVGDTKGYYTIDKDGLSFVEGICPKFENININNSAAFLKAYEISDDKAKEKIRKNVEGNIIKLIMNEYSNENEKIYKIIKGMAPLEISVTYNRINFEDGADDGEVFNGFDNKTDIVDILYEYVDKIKEKIPEGIKLQEIKELIKKKNFEFKTSSQ